jgi:histone acetyltransferase
LSDAEEAAFVAEAVDEDEDDEEDKPLAARMATISSASRAEKSPRVPGQRSGKKMAHTVPVSLPPPIIEPAQFNGINNGTNGRDLSVKVEDMMDDSQLTRLAAGVTVDTAKGTTVGVRNLLIPAVLWSNVLSLQPPIRQEKAAAIELRKGVIQVTPVENDKSHRSLVILTGLKTLFQKQLPNMPREYIARLVYDANSKDLAIIKRAYKVVGGICYRPFPHRGFAEIVFFATASVDQEKVYPITLKTTQLLTTYRDMGQC